MKTVCQHKYLYIIMVLMTWLTICSLEDGRILFTRLYSVYYDLDL